VRKGLVMIEKRYELKFDFEQLNEAVK
jgi:hypothetical protein